MIEYYNIIEYIKIRGCGIRFALYTGMKNKKEIFNRHDMRMKTSIKNSGFSQEFGLRVEQVYEDTVRKAKKLGLLAGQAESLYRIINKDKR